MIRVCTSLLLFAVLLITARREASAAGDVKKAAKKPTRMLTVGKATTHFTEPLDADGYVDYPAAVNERLRQGVTPENNANVLLWKAFGPHPVGAKMPREFFRWMGMGTLADEGDYFIDQRSFLKTSRPRPDEKESSSIDDELERATQQPWTAKELPRMAAWLQANEKPLTVALAATKRREYFSPMVAHRTKEGRGPLIASLVPGVMQCRDVARALSARAMLALGEGRAEDAWRDLLACHRLGRLVGRGGTLIEFLVGVAIESVAGDGELALLERGKLDAKRIKALGQELRQLPARSTVADKIDLVERCTYLETVQMVERHGPGYLETMAGGKPSTASNPFAKLAVANVDWDPALRDGNRWFDRFTAALRIADRNEREQQLDRLDIEIRELRNNATKPGVLKVLGAFIASPAARGKNIGDILITLLLPAQRKVQQAGDRIEQVERNLQIAFALAAYQRDRGKYPPKLDALVPDYLKKIPDDLFSGKALIYSTTETGYLLYSFGVNAKDDGGQSYADDPPGDDLSVRMPRPAAQQQKR
jgi:hypothetical protein